MSKQYLPLEKLRKRSAFRKALNKTVPKLSTKSSLGYGSVKKYCPGVYDQGQLGSCTANAFCGAYRIMENIKTGNVSFEPSRLYLYYYERLLENTVNEDSGADVIDGESYVKQNGICSETSWPYDITKYTVQPPANCTTEAVNHKISSYQTIPIDNNLINNIRQSIDNQTPVLIAISVFDSFESDFTAQTGMVTIPKPNEQSLGGHEMCLVGYTDSKKLFTVLNSWGPNWGNGGFCYIPYDYLTNPNLGMEFTVFNL